MVICERVRVEGRCLHNEFAEQTLAPCAFEGLLLNSTLIVLGQSGRSE
jgi:hypothetical protein